MSQVVKTPDTLPRYRATQRPHLVSTLLWLIIGLWSWSWLGPTWLRAMRPQPDQIVDFYQDWGSARNYWCNLPVYAPHSTSIPRHLRLSSNPMPSIEYNIHPPSSILMALPLGRLSYPDAVLVWNLVSLGALTASIIIVARLLPVPSLLYLPAVALLPFCLPVLGNLQMGQMTMILSFLLTVMWALERSGWRSMGGAFLGAAAAVKLFPIYLAVYYVLQRQVRPLLAALASLVILTVITVLVLGLDSYADYVGIVLPWNSQFRIFGYNLSIAGFWHKLFNPLNEGEKIIPLWRSLAVARWGTICSNLAITAVLVTVTRQAQTRSQYDLAFATTMIGMLLVSPVTWDTSLLLLLAPIAIIACSNNDTKLPWMPIALALVLPIIWLPQPFLTMILTGGQTVTIAPPSFLLGAASLKFYALLGIFVLGLVALRADIANMHRGLGDGATPA